MSYILKFAAIPVARVGQSHTVTALFTPILDQSAGNTLDAFDDWENWPKTLESFTFSVLIATPSATLPATRVSEADRDTWALIFDRTLPVRTPANRAASERRAENYESFEGTILADSFTKTYELAAVEAGGILGRLARTVGPASALLPLEEPLASLSTLHRDAREWGVWLPDNASEQEKAATELIAACAEPVAQGNVAFQGDLTRVSRQADDETNGEPSLGRKLRRLNAMVLRGLLEKHNLWQRVRDCASINASPLNARREFLAATAAHARRVADAALFHRIPAPRSADRLIQNRMDFHDYLAALTQHPPLLARLGLAVRLTFDWSDNLTARGRLRIRASRSGHDPVDSPWTMFERNANQFLPSGWQEGDPGPRPGRRIRHGFLNLSGDYELRSIDTHEAYSKFKATGSPIGTGQEGQPLRAPGQDNPKLHTAGLVLIEKSPALKLGVSVVRSESMRAAVTAEIPLYAEDLVSGLRIDARRVGDAWKSLCLRETRYDFVDPSLHVLDSYEPNPADRRTEGAVSQGVSHTSDGGPPQVQEEVFRWQHWSLAVPLPTKRVPPLAYDPVRQPPPVLARHRAKVATLPWLEFSRTYEVRCRAMFLDGSGLSQDDVNDAHAQLSSKFERQEWVASPNVLLANPLDATRNCGEGSTILAIRSTNGRPSRQVAARYVVPPKVDSTLPIYHGHTIREGVGAFQDRAFRADGAFISAHDLKRGPNTTHPDDISTMDRNPIWTRQRNADPVFNRYYPDPLAYEFHIWLEWSREISGRPEAIRTEYTLYDSPTEWPRSRALKMMLVSAPRDQQADGGLRVLRRGQSYAGVRAGDEDVLLILLRTGVSARLLIGTLPFTRSGGGPIGTEAVEPVSVRWIARLGDDATFRTLSGPEQRLLLAAHPFANSPREIRVVHAIDKPFLRPRFVALEPILRESVAPIQLRCRVCFSVPTTGRLDISAEWTDWLDDSATQIGISGGEAVGDGAPGLRAAKTTSHVPPPLDIAPPNGAWQHEETRPFDLTHVLPDTKHREITYSIRATTRYREFFEPAGQAGQQVNPRFSVPGENRWRVRILNRAIPRELEVVFPVPAFDWQRSRRDGIYNAFRRGGILRLYLKRPWNCSGNDEMLGVVLADGPDAGPAGAVSHRISRWGQDPVRDSLAVSPVLTLGNFKSYDTHLNNVPLLKESGTVLRAGQPPHPGFEREPVTVVGYLPKFPNRGSCYVDVELDPGRSYYPFVSLSLARFQQYSVRGLHLSATTRLDTIQVPPHRWVQAWRERGTPQMVVRMFGYTYGRTAPPQSHTGTRLRVSVEERISGTDPELCWVPSLTQEGAQIRAEAFPRPYASLPVSADLGPDFVPSDYFSYWEARVALPDRAFATNYRILIEEIEMSLSEVLAESNEEQIPKRWELTRTTPMERVVFTDIVEV